MAGVSALRFSQETGIQNQFDDDADSAVGTVDEGSTTLSGVFVDNSALATLLYLRLWDDSDAVKGTTAPAAIIPVAISGILMVTCIGGLTLDTGLQYNITSDAGTTGVTDPATPPDIYFTTNGGN